MEKYISLSALVAEIERRYAEHDADYNNGDETELHRMVEDRAIIKYIDTLEVKEVDLEREIQAFAKMDLEPLEIYDANIGISITMSQLYKCARHFLNLG